MGKTNIMPPRRDDDDVLLPRDTYMSKGVHKSSQDFCFMSRVRRFGKISGIAANVSLVLIVDNV